MVATRNHPKEFPDPETAAAMAQSTDSSSPRKRATRTSTANSASPTKAVSSSPPATPTRTSRSSKPVARDGGGGWSHTPSNLTLIWLAVSLPLVVWDTGYVVLRPHSMPGGFLHKPLWAPYGLYGTIDHMYGFKHLNLGTGWTAAQGTINAAETAAYFAYLYLLYTYGEQEPRQGTGAPAKSLMGQFRALSESRTVYGKMAAWTAVLGYSVATVTFWKTVLYMLNESFSGFDNIGHNDFVTLFFLWIIPNGAWLLFPGYMIYVFGRDILQGLEAAASKKSR